MVEEEEIIKFGVRIVTSWMEFMLEVTHRRIAKEIAKALKLSKRESGLLESGSIQPDYWADFPHHYGKSDEIVEDILMARKLYLKNDDECYFRLGVALHYIADSWTLRPRISDKHTKWEEQIEKMPILDDSQLEEVIKNSIMPSKEVELYLAHLPVLKLQGQMISRALQIETSLKEEIQDNTTLEERYAKELMKFRNHNFIERKEHMIKDFGEGFVPVDDILMHAATLTAAFPPLETVIFIASSSVKLDLEEEGNILIWCVPTRRIIGDWLILHMIKIMESKKIKRGILITRGCLSQEAERTATMNRLEVVHATGFFISSTIPRRLSTWSNPIIDLNFAYRICLEVARSVLSS